MAWERQSGHWKMLVARGLSHGEIVLGKWCALVALAALALLLCAPYAVVLSLLGAEPVGLLVAGYLALGVYAASMAAIGIAAGAMTPYPPVAYLIAAAIGLFFQYIFGMLAEWFAGGWLRVFDHFHFGYHLQNLFAGRLEFSAVVFFASSIAFFLWLARLPWAVRRNRPILSLSKAAARAPSDAPAASTSGAS
jgi:ABC-2 type transport system permease protein